ncbi:hypothetical protein [Nocardia sp. NRRL S-836]|uniref:hypothetical protein n=1 Tax=Nocardia sp. NRRL S-836 TaxID=1519492 RepID=UPI0006AF0D7A|nr:hypothetical protein [Nocardia sp. NRRL S-836]KOV81511.1 hypothetical protein ADL03_29385 [Nocardia sp. NRRL S-836]
MSERVLVERWRIAAVVLVHRPRQPVGEPEEEAVVVHRFVDDDTPPFGIVVPVEVGEHRRD